MGGAKGGKGGKGEGKVPAGDDAMRQA